MSFVPPGSGFNLCPLAISSGLYSCALLVVLNSRIKFKVASFSTTWKDGPVDMHISVANVGHGGSTMGETSSFANDYGVTVAFPQDSCTGEALNDDLTKVRCSSFNTKIIFQTLYTGEIRELWRPSAAKCAVGSRQATDMGYKTLTYLHVLPGQ